LLIAKVAVRLGLTRRQDLGLYVREYRNGRDLTAHSRDLMAIDLLGLRAEEVRKRFPEVYQYELHPVLLTPA
jgi:hypothetical protein